MGLIFDIHSARLYDAWRRSSRGRAMDSFLEKIIPEMLKPRKNERVLDIGCGTGNHLLLLNRLGLEINGVDASPYMIDMARKRLGNKCALRTGNAKDLPFDDNEFDLAVLINTLEFLDNPLQALREAGRVAKRKVFIGVMNSVSWYCLCDKLQGLFRETLLNHVRSYNLWDLKSYLQIAFGDVPITWRSAQIWPSFFNRIGMSVSEICGLNHWPIGAFLGLSATITYRIKTDSLPLKIGVKKTGQSIAGGITMGNVKLNKGIHYYERNLSL